MILKKKNTCCSEKRLCLLASRDAIPKKCLAATQTSGDASTTVTWELGRALWRKAGNVQPPPPKTQMCRLHLFCWSSWIKLCRAMPIPRPSRCVAVSPWMGGGLEWSGSPFASKTTQLWQYARRWLKCKERREGFLPCSPLFFYKGTYTDANKRVNQKSKRKFQCHTQLRYHE
jgi:hypothetical protein